MTALATLVAGDSSSSDNPAPTIAIDWKDSVIVSGGSIYGVAVSQDGPIVVTALLNGSQSLGAPDTSSTSTTNAFCFAIPRSQGPSVITIIASDKTGLTTRILIPVPG